MKTVITLRDLFPEEQDNDLDFYLDGVDKLTLLKVGTFFSSFYRNSSYENPIEFIRMYFSRGSEEFMNLVIERLRAFVVSGERPLEEYSFIYIRSSLSLFEYAYDNGADEHSEFAVQELDEKLLKAYLLFNQINKSNGTDTLMESIDDLEAEQKLVALTIGIQLNDSELLNYNLHKILATQSLRAIYFFEFLNLREDCNELLREFYNFYEVENYKDYISKILPILFKIILREKEAHIDFSFEENVDNDDAIGFLEKFTIDDSSELSDFDFRNTRSKPLFKIKERTYRLIYPLFVMELLGNGLYFKLKAINEDLTDDKKVANLYNLKNLDFSEKYVLNKLLKYIFGNKYIQKSGEELDRDFPGAPDYYCRNGKKIFLFESKDIMINASVKQSSDFNKIDEELRLKLYENQRGSPKAVVQLINNIRKVLNDSLEFDTGFKPRNVVVYPIIVVHHRVFNTAGINKWVNFWFREELSKLGDEGLEVSNVRDVMIIDIDTLIFSKDELANKLKLEKCCDEYHKDYLNFDHSKKKYKSQEEVNQARQNSMLPFSEFIENKIDENRLRGYPIEFENRVKSLLKG